MQIYLNYNKNIYISKIINNIKDFKKLKLQILGSYGNL